MPLECWHGRRGPRRFLRAQGRQLLGHRQIDELVERNTLSLSQLAGLIEKRGLKPQRILLFLMTSPVASRFRPATPQFQTALSPS